MPVKTFLKLIEFKARRNERICDADLWIQGYVRSMEQSGELRIDDGTATVPVVPSSWAGPLIAGGYEVDELLSSPCAAAWARRGEPSEDEECDVGDDVGAHRYVMVCGGILVCRSEEGLRFRFVANIIKVADQPNVILAETLWCASVLSETAVV